MYRVLVAALVTLLLLPAGTSAAERPAPPPPEEAARHAAVLALIQFPWQQLEYEIVFLPARKGFRALTIPAKRRIEVYARPQDDVRMIAYDLAHEIGHAIDVSLNTEEIRRKWLEFRGLNPTTVWFGCNRCSDYNTPAGDFAETFARIVLGPEFFRGRIAPAIPESDLPAAMSFFPKEFFPAPPQLTVTNAN
jgi:hypothetical protein